MIRHYFLTTIRTLRQNALYTALSVFGIALTFVFVCILFLIAKGTKSDFIPPKYAERTWSIFQITQEGGRGQFISKEQYEAWVPKMKTPEMIVISTRDVMELIVLEDKIAMSIINCVNENFFEACKLKFLRGRPLNKQEITERIPVAVIDRYMAELCFRKDEDPIGKNIELGGIQFRVTGVVENNSLFTVNNGFSGNVWIPLETMPTSQIRYILSFTAKDKASIADIQAEFTRVLNETNTAEGVQYSINDRQKESISQREGWFDGTSLILSIFIMMLIPALNILSLNISKSHDRSEEIAVRKAFGAPLRTIFVQLFFENILLTLVGAIIGMCITPFLLSAIDQIMSGFNVLPLTFSLHFDLVTVFMVAVPCVLLFGFLSGSIPALIIAKKDIVNVLKGELQ